MLWAGLTNRLVLLRLMNTLTFVWKIEIVLTWSMSWLLAIFNLLFCTQSNKLTLGFPEVVSHHFEGLERIHYLVDPHVRASIIHGRNFSSWLIPSTLTIPWATYALVQTKHLLNDLFILLEPLMSYSFVSCWPPVLVNFKHLQEKISARWSEILEKNLDLT